MDPRILWSSFARSPSAYTATKVPSFWKKADCMQHEIPGASSSQSPREGLNLEV